jgi:U3 small nucleolar RNA-associated protein 3
MNIPRDVTKMTEAQRVKMISSETPEFFPLISELKERIVELRERVVPMRALAAEIRSHGPSSDELVQYLEVKQQLLLAYCTNVVFYLLMKAEGKSVRSHPVMKQLLGLCYAIEKLRSLDGKLKYQIDRLLKSSGSAVVDPREVPKSSSRPNPRALLAEEVAEEEAPKKTSKRGASEEIYKAPRMAAMPYRDGETDGEWRQERLDKKRKKLKNSEMFEALRDEFGSVPEEASNTGLTNSSADQRVLEEEAAERRDFEEERFVRLTMTRKDKQSLKRRERDAGRFDTVNNIGDIGDFEEVNDMVAMSAKLPSASESRSAVSEAGSSAAERAMKALLSASEGKGSKSRAMDMDYDDEDMGVFADMLETAGAGDKKKRSRRPAPSSTEDAEGDAEEGILEAFSKRKKEFQSLKKEHYTAEPRYGGVEEAVDGDSKRAASYEIMKNKGLTPHRKKANRNPRVKKREAYDKAVVRRKGQVRDVISGAAATYGGELTGIKANIARSRRISN